MRTLPFLWAAALCLTLGVPGSAHVPTASVQPQEEEAEEVQRLEAWPELDKDAAKAVKSEVSRLRKARTEAMGEQANEALIALGAGAAPALLAALGKEKGEEARERITGVLEVITGAAHTRLLAAEFGHRSALVRVWAMERAAAFPDPGTRAPAEAAWAKLEKLHEKKKVDATERTAGALALAASGSVDSLAYLFEHGKKKWRKRGAQIRVAVEACRGEQATRLIGDYLKSAERSEKVCALRMLAGCGAGDVAIRMVRPSLDSEDNEVRIAAINALRGIVDGDPPIEKLSAFQAIETAKKWKQRV